MKRFLVIFLGIITIFTVIFSLACPPEPEPELTKKWTISGTAKFTTTKTDNIKLAAYYTGDGLIMNTSSKLVSNVVNLGNETTTDAKFSLKIDASSLSPSTGHYIKIVFWRDADNNNKCDVSSESNYSACPNKTNGCPCFGPYDSLAICSYYYDEGSNSFMGTQKGWNQRTGSSKYTPIDSAKKSGATIESSYDF
ncbi:MAG TPA: hypothetical protein PLE45_04200 [Spirochaetota bacterium]|nr:hypothetical protein [Spirochaetota bacterium]HOL57085.1 hypothetical protein [Spirochaetota bacterium]HPP04694.1 hypothetical protein [Spirochaetota bacterium]